MTKLFSLFSFVVFYVLSASAANPITSLTQPTTLTPDASAPAATLSSASVAFGNENVYSESKLQSVTLSNTGNASLLISRIALSGIHALQYLTSDTCGSSLAAGASCSIRLRFYPKIAGSLPASLTVSDNASGSTQSIALTGTGIVPPTTTMSLSASSIAFSSQVVKTESALRTVSLTNTGTSALVVENVAITGTNAPYFMTSNNCGASVAKGASCTVDVRFDPQTAIASTATLKIRANSSANAITSISLTGTGTPASVPQLTINPGSLSFGDVAVNTKSTLPVTLTSTGTSAVTISAAALTGTGFTMSGATFPVTLNPNLAVTVDVQFQPTTSGNDTGQLTIHSNATTSPTVAVALSGAGDHQVQLAWAAPASSSDPVTGYNIYRSAGGSSSYQLLNAAIDTKTSYVDSGVQSGTTYDYVVKSVDSTGMESTPSNQIVLAIP